MLTLRGMTSFYSGLPLISSFVHLGHATFTKLKGPVCLGASKLNKTQTGVCSKESKSFLAEEVAPPRDKLADAQRHGPLMISMGWVVEGENHWP